ncbi:xyloglucan O-acetyltransferase 2-like [Impatiens glandulifera]|uniref:xyloglucan O-acetyltransferase 2-like n=1 Tax=Impatiens glandulifera TaxID=253017 RepID=UPI001FB1614E|nr:xyloglucan O-acetyltransferase 2-like [Impatiens glandulifera]
MRSEAGELGKEVKRKAMETSSSSSSSSSSSRVKKFLPWSLFAILPLALFHLYFHSVPLSQQQLLTTTHHLSNSHQQSITPPKENGGGPDDDDKVKCDYTNGKWVPEKRETLYNGTNCSNTISYGQNCMINGRPDSGYLHWRWQPHQIQCRFPIFNPHEFLSLTRNKHLAFVGDSLSRNQIESLICMLTTVSVPVRVYDILNAFMFRRWEFSSHNLTVSSYWSPFLVKANEKNASKYYSELFLESVDEKWAEELDKFDMVLFMAGQWLMTPAVYYYNGSVIGCHLSTDQNCTEVGFYDAFGKMIKTTLETVIGRRSGNARSLDVIVTTYPPAHFEGQWDKFGACPKTRPFKEGEKALGDVEFQMRRVEMIEVEAAKIRVQESAPSPSSSSGKIRVEALDITKLSWMRPDAHPGPYMNKNPFSKGIKDKVANDCLHWCLPGPTDTWNEILLETIKKWTHKIKV